MTLRSLIVFACILFDCILLFLLFIFCSALVVNKAIYFKPPSGPYVAIEQIDQMQPTVIDVCRVN